MNKKADVEFELILKLIVALMLILIIIGIIFIFKEKSLLILEKIKEILRFG